MPKTARPLSESHLGPTRRARSEVLVNGRQDTRRMAGKELGWFQQAIAHRPEFPCNIWFVGDSMTECYGVTDDYHKWVDIIRTAIQGRYRNGGIGYIASKHAQGIPWPYTTNPDGKNVWAQTAGAEVDNVDYGFGFGRRSSFQPVAGGRSITVDCDRFWINYTCGTTGTFTIDVDAGTPFAQTATVNTATNGSFSGRIWDSFRDGAMTLSLGTHTIKVTTSVASSFLDGATIFYTDALQGIHVYEGGHSGMYAQNFDAHDGASTYWADLAYQPASPSAFLNFVTNCTTTVTSTTAAFTDLDIGDWIAFDTRTLCKNGMARIVARASGTSITVDRVVTASGAAIATMNRAQFTDGVIWGNKVITDAVTNSTTTLTSAAQGAFTPNIVGASVSGSNIPAGTYVAAYVSATNVTLSAAATSSATITATFGGTTNMTSATAAFTPWDVGMYVQGPTGIPAGTFIRRYNSATSVELSTAATAAQTAQTVRVLGRQRHWAAPDLVSIEFGINDVAAAITTAAYKQSLRDIVSAVTEKAGIGFPVGSVQRYNPSIVLLGMWATGTTKDFGAYIAANSGSPIITTTDGDFDQSDVGRTITTPSNTPIAAATTIASVQSANQATLSANAVATSASTLATIVQRQQLDKHWQRMRTALFELATENTWRFFDLYSLGGYIGTTDPLNLTYDFTHPNNHGAQWIADELDIVLTGQPKNSAIPEGIIDAKGDLIVGSAADIAGKLPTGVDGQGLRVGSGATLGLLHMDPSSGAALGQVIPVIGGTTALVTGLPAPTLTATVSNADDNEASWLSFATSTTQFNPSGIVSATFTVTRAGRLPEFDAYLKTGSSAATSLAYAIGLSSASLDVASAVAPAASVQGAYFLYNTTVHGTAFWRTCTSNGTTITTNTTTTAVGVSTTFRPRIVMRGTRSPSQLLTGIDFYINDVLVATHTTNLPAVATPLGYSVRVEALAAAAARSILVARIGLSGP